MAKEKKKKKNGGKTVAAAGVLAIIAALLGAGVFGFGGGGAGSGNSSGTNSNKDYLMQDNQIPTVIPPATVTPAEGEVVQLTEVEVTVKKDKVIYKGEEYNAQSFPGLLENEYSEKKESILIKVTMEEAIYDTVEELKVVLEKATIKYEILE